ncbi:MAG: O-antigen polymerase [Desulfococcaceae bacterium]
MNLYLIDNVLFFLLLGNLVIWLTPYIFYGKNLFSPQGILAYLFSSSYWIPIIFLIFNPEGYIAPNIDKYYIKYAALCSFIAGAGYMVSYYIIKIKFSDQNLYLKPIVFDIKNKFHIKIIIWILYIIANILLVYCMTESFDWVGIGGRRLFLDSKPFWYLSILPISGYFIALGFFLYFVSDNVKEHKLYFFGFVSEIFLIIMNGFDGGRRYAAFVIFLSFVGYIYWRQLPITIISNKHKNEIKNVKKRTVFFIVCSIFLMTIFSWGRKGTVGWNVVLENEVSYSLYNTVERIIAPVTTIHVNTQMAKYITLYGEQGYYNYFQAIGNMFFPEFFWGEYLFGMPLVLKLHDELHWRGQDFGILAEAIYSNGLVGCFVIHFILGCIANFIYLKWIKGSNIYGIFYLTFIFGILNSVRSDFMNFLKSWVYLGIALNFIYIIFIIKTTNYNLKKNNLVSNRDSGFIIR